MKFLKKIDPNILFIFALFLSTRIILFVLTVLSYIKFDKIATLPEILGSYKVLAAWDSGWYLRIAEFGYSASAVTTSGQATYAFFPLYPTLVHFLGNILNNNFILAGIIISNICLLVGLIFFYKFLKIEEGENRALIAIKYLVLFPSAFIFSAVMTESLFLMLMSISLYYMKKHNWLAACVAGFFLATTRSLGMLILIPLVFEYLQVNNISLQTFNVKRLTLNVFYFALIPLGFIIFGVYVYSLTGDIFGVLKVQSGWGRESINPIIALVKSLYSENFGFFLQSSFTILIIGLIIYNFKKIKISYWIFALLLAFVPLLNSSLPFHIASMPRYLLVIFPIYIIFARFFEKHPKYDQLATICLALCQAIFLLFWSLNLSFIV